jgi:hypothetical protein
LRIAVTLFICLVLTLLAAVELYSQAPAADLLPGIWQGAVQSKRGTMQVFFTIEKKENNVYMGKTDIPAQNARNIPMTAVHWAPPTLFLDMSSFGVTFEGTMAADGSAITGLFKIGPDSLSLELRRTEKVPELRRSQDPQKPYPYDEIEVKFPNSAAGIELAGTLTVPRETGPFPAVVLISGSGPQDRDSTLAGHRTFLVLADYLTRRGIAVLRYDDRGCGKSGGDFHQASTADFASDALAAWEFLKRREHIVPERVGLIGHSEGAMAAAIIGPRQPEIAFMVFLAGSGIPGEQLLLSQIAAIGRGRGVSEEALAKELLLNERLLLVVRQHDDPLLAESEMLRVASKSLDEMTAAEKKELNHSSESLAQDIKAMITDFPWTRFIAAYDPAVDLRRVHCPVLVLNGDKDTQILADIHLPAIEKALRSGGNKEVSIEKMPGLNHLFQTAQTGLPREYGKIEETISPMVLQRIGDWILQRSPARKSN